MFPNADQWGPMAILGHLQLGFLAALNVVIAFSSRNLEMYRDIYDVAPQHVNPLSAHMFGAWTAISAAVRFLTASDVHNAPLYFLTCFSLATAVAHFLTEWLVFGTATWTGVWLSLVLDAVSLVYLVAAWPGKNPKASSV